ncbi:hypothetical protein LRE75_37445 [Streptomyces sp. 372A]
MANSTEEESWETYLKEIAATHQKHTDQVEQHKLMLEAFPHLDTDGAGVTMTQIRQLLQAVGVSSPRMEELVKVFEDGTDDEGRVTSGMFMDVLMVHAPLKSA